MNTNSMGDPLDMITIDLPQELIDGLVAESIASNQSVNEVIRQAIEHYLIFVAESDNEIDAYAEEVED